MSKGYYGYLSLLLTFNICMEFCKNDMMSDIQRTSIPEEEIENGLSLSPEEQII